MVKTSVFDPAEYLDNPESIAAYLQDAYADSPAEFLEALGVVARAKGMTEVANAVGVARPALYRSLSSEGRPEFTTVMSVLNAVGVGFRIAANSTPEKPARRTRRTRIGA